MKFSIKDLFSEYGQIQRKLRIGHIYWRNPEWKNSFFVQCIMQHKLPLLSEMILDSWFSSFSGFTVI